MSGVTEHALTTLPQTRAEYDAWRGVVSHLEAGPAGQGAVVTWSEIHSLVVPHGHPHPAAGDAVAGPTPPPVPQALHAAPPVERHVAPRFVPGAPGEITGFASSTPDAFAAPKSRWAHRRTPTRRDR